MLSIVEHDLGTPASDSAQSVTLTIDGQEVTVRAGGHVGDGAALSDEIPKLCATEQLEAFAPAACACKSKA
jgi:formate dehydrogenase major subunit